MSSSVVGLACLLFFAISQGMRDAFFGNVFQSVSFLIVAVLAFSSTTIVFSGIAVCRNAGSLRALLASRPDFFAMNLTNALAWLSFFFALRYLEPAVVATLYNGIGPLAVLSLRTVGWIQAEGRISGGESLCYAGIAGALSGLIYVVLTDRSGVPLTAFVLQSSALAAVIFGGIMITISYVFARRFNDKDVGSDAIFGTRFLLALAAAGLLETLIGSPSTRPALETAPYLTAMAFGLIVIPGFMLQLGVARASALAVNVFRALGPVFVFAVQQLDGRLRFSGATLGCVVAFCVCAVIASLLRGSSEAKRAF